MTAGGQVIVLNEQRAVASPHGAALWSWSVAGEEKLSSTHPLQPGHLFDGATLVPWPNRVRDGRYRYDGRIHQLPVNEPGRRTALHGLAADVAWQEVRHEACAVAFRHSLGPRDGYPFAVDVQVDYRVGPEGLSVELSAVNHGDQAAPFGGGSHPYLRLRDGVDGAMLELPARTRVPVDDRLLPSGPPLGVEGTGLDFRSRRSLAAVTLDTCFGDLARDDDGLARIRVWEAQGTRPVTLWLDEGFPFVHVYTADHHPDPGRRRSRLAVEPVTCAPDAFNSGHGLITLSPGDRFRARWGLSAGP